MHHGADVVTPDCLGHLGAVADIALDEGAPAHELFVAINQIIVGNRLIARFGQGLASVKPI